MGVALELAEGSRWSEKRWELVADGAVAGRLEQTAWWRRSWRVAAGGRAWDVASEGVFKSSLVARDRAGEVARYVAREWTVERRDAPPLTVRREGLVSGQRALLDGDRELVRLNPRHWRRGIEVEPADGVRLDEDLVLAVLLVCARLVAERQDTTAATTAATAGGVAAGS